MPVRRSTQKAPIAGLKDSLIVSCFAVISLQVLVHCSTWAELQHGHQHGFGGKPQRGDGTVLNSAAKEAHQWSRARRAHGLI